MKKLIFVLLAVTLVTFGVSALADEPCTHENRTETGDWWYEYDNDNAFDNEDGSHTLPAYRITEYQCDDCTETFTVKNEEAEQVIELHYFFNGFCTTCGAENPCKHTVSAYVVETDREYDENVTRDNGDNTHTVKYRNYSEYYCNTCRSSYTVYDETWTGPVSEDHIWVHTGVCDVCHADNSCKHPNFEESEVSVYRRYEYNDSDIHVACGSLNTRYYCADCGMDELEYQSECQIEEPHDFTNGNCICGACAHLNAVADPQDAWTECYDAVDNGDGTHTGTLFTIAGCRCPDCNEYIEKVLSTEEGAIAAHVFGNDGLCYTCGAKNPCDHSGEKYAMVFGGDLWSAEYTITETTHSIPASLTLLTFCDVCKQLIDTKYIQDNPHVSAHSFVDGVCNSCGYENTCEHANLSVIYQLTLDYTLQKSEPIEGTNRHTVQGYILNYNECLSCGERFEQSKVEVTTTEEHYFSNGVCCDCGYKNPCEHKNIVTDEETKYRTALDLGDEGHRATAWTQISRYCRDCGETFDYKASKPADKVMEHHYENGICDDCGHVNSCSHENTSTKTERELVVLAFNQNKHTLYMQEQQRTYCECGDLISSTPIGEARTITERHSFYREDDLNICEFCNYSEEYKEEDISTMTTLTLPASSLDIQSEAFVGTDPQVIIIPKTCVSVAPDAFDDCPNLIYIINYSNVTITPPEGVELINK